MKYLAFSAAIAAAMAGTASAEMLQPTLRLDEVRLVEAAPLPAMTKEELILGRDVARKIAANAANLDPATREAMLEILQPSN